jgi:probable nitrogen fixation protein
MTDSVLAENEPLLETELMKAMVKQMRALDSYGQYDQYSSAQLLDPFILTKERKREIPIVGDPDEEIISRVKAFHNAIATLIEQSSGLMAVPLVNLTYEGFGRVIITVGRLVVLDRSLRDVHRFGFPSLAKLQEEGDKKVSAALALIKEHRSVAEL